MLNINLKSRLENKAFWVSLISAIILLLQQVGLTTLANYIPANYADIINTIFVIATILGIAVDTSTPGISDQPITTPNTSTTIIDTTTTVAPVDATQQASNVSTSTDSQIQDDISNAQADSSSQLNQTAQVTDTSASSKIKVDNPDNSQQIGATVNSISASNPQ